MKFLLAVYICIALAGCSNPSGQLRGGGQLSPTTVGVASPTSASLSSPAGDASSAEPVSPQLASALEQTAAYQQLPEIKVTVKATLVASPSHPTAQLMSDPISAGGLVRVLGTDRNAAWLLVLHNDTLGWIPSFYSGTGTSTLKLAMLNPPLSETCVFLGATFAPEDVWVSKTNGATIVQGMIYRPQPTPTEGASPTVAIEGEGKIAETRIDRTSLGASGEIQLFTFTLADLQQDSRIRFQMANLDGEVVAFQAAFFNADCPQPATKATGVVTSRELNVRSGPGAEYDKVGLLKVGDTIEILGSQIAPDGGTWLEIRSPSGTSGWVNDNFVQRQN